MKRVRRVRGGNVYRVEESDWGFAGWREEPCHGCGERSEFGVMTVPVISESRIWCANCFDLNPFIFVRTGSELESRIKERTHAKV